LKGFDGGLLKNYTGLASSAIWMMSISSGTLVLRKREKVHYMVTDAVVDQGPIMEAILGFNDIKEGTHLYARMQMDKMILMLTTFK
jgi:hypothetical protein